MDFKTHFIKQLGSNTYGAFEDALNQNPVSGLIVNLKKTNITQVKSIFSEFNNHPLIKDALTYNSTIKLGNHPLFHAGAFYIQDPSAMLVAYLLDVKASDKVIDLAAAPGGKTFQVATRLDDTGLLIANDISYSRAKTLSSNIEKFGFKNVIVTANQPHHFNNYYQGYFDKVILDAPCSGEGMFRKDELAKNDWSIGKVTSCSINQKQLILDGYKLLKKGGIMVYSTCTFSLEENEEIINYLLANTNAKLVSIMEHPSFERGINQSQSIRIYPFKFPGEGHFIALIQSHDTYTSDFIPKITNPKASLNLLEKFIQENTNIVVDYTSVITHNGTFYLKPKTNFNYQLFNTLRVGINLGEVDQNNFYPNHNFAMASKPNDFKKIINLKLHDKQLNDYISGNVLDIKDDGFYLVTVEGISLGFAKVINGSFKNYYPKGLRIK